ncbi:sec-independent protein translocase protein TATB, chloroplastic [Nymphaea colorata]|nr:sec-independent protein translocase protein TATB, chloroplastic [Nymphaea colorata]
MALTVASATSSFPNCLLFSPTHPKSAFISAPAHFSLAHYTRLLPFKPLASPNVLIHLGVSPKQRRLGRRERRMNSRYGTVYASLFGVGAPEALVIGVVALLVFGPKGLAEVARNLGKTLRAFRPTIQELQEVSRDFKSTLQREIGLDDVPTQQSYRPTPTYMNDNLEAVADKNGPPAGEKSYSSKVYLKVTEEELKAASADAAKLEISANENLSEVPVEISSHKKKPEDDKSA